MKVICALGELANFVHVEIPLYFKFIQFHTIHTNSKVFLKYVVGWDWLLVYSLSLNFGLTNLQKATWPFFWE